MKQRAASLAVGALIRTSIALMDAAGWIARRVRLDKQVALDELLEEVAHEYEVMVSRGGEC